MADRTLPLDSSQLAGASKLDDDGKTATLKLGNGRKLSVFSSPDLDQKLAAANPPEGDGFGKLSSTLLGLTGGAAGPLLGYGAEKAQQLGSYLGGELAKPGMGAVGDVASRIPGAIQRVATDPFGGIIGAAQHMAGMDKPPADVPADQLKPDFVPQDPLRLKVELRPPEKAPGAAPGKPGGARPAGAGGPGGGGTFGAGTGAIAQGFGEQMQGKADEAKAEQAQNEGAAKLHKEEADRAENAAWDLAKLREQHSLEQRDILGKAMGLIDSLDTSVKSPQQIWSSKSGGEKMGLVLGQVLAGVGGGIQGRPPEDLIRKHIGDEVAAQQAAYERTKDKAGQVLTMYGKFREQGLSEEQAREATGAALSKVAEDRLKAFTASSNNPLVATRAKQAIGAMRTDLGKGLQNTAKLGAEIAQTRAQTDYTRAQEAASRVQAQNKGGANGLVVGGAQLRFSDEKEKGEFENQVNAGTSLRNALQEVIENGAKPGAIATIQRALGMGKDVNRATAARDTAATMINPALGKQTEMSVPMLERFNHALTSAWNPDAVKAGAFGVMADARKALTQRLVAKGMAPGDAQELALRQLPPLPGEGESFGASGGFR